MPDEYIRRDEKLLCGRLVALPSSITETQLNTLVDRADGYRSTISIDFPAMPDVIELARSADYLVNYNIVMPDGIHQYKGTKPLEIPISFRIHSMDEQYCKKGALTLMQLAARLHSFVLPISTFNRGTTTVALAETTQVPQNGGRRDDAQTQAGAAQDQVYKITGASGTKGQIFSPVTCWLHLMWIGNTQPGISCVGYVREVKVKFNGPWLRGPNNSFNLPTSADFEFVFVHRPGHGNSQSFTTSQFPQTTSESGQAFADDVKNTFYNTRDLVHAANYQGFASDANNSIQINPPPNAAAPVPTPQNPTPIVPVIVEPIT